MKATKIIIVEDDQAVQRALEEWLSDNYEIKCYDSAEDFLVSFNDFEFEDGVPTCMLLDFQMPGMNGVELQETLKQMNPAFPIVFMSGNANQAEIIDAWRGGAIDFILKPFTGDEISVALSKVINVHKSNLHHEEVYDETEPLDIPITTREAQALLLLGMGHRQSEVAELMGVALRTVKMYRVNLKNKIGLNTPVDLSRFCDRYKVQIKKIAVGND